ncbi:hypothetical protein GJ904_19925 [Salmonella enterica]|nr:hypothetical protein [Salmonella enterica subsp. enterica serovar Saintpaul]EEC1303333.1 hypothetical protein [Salmonella enterica]
MTALLTPEAVEAIKWMRQRMPDGIFEMFQAEMEQAIGPVVAKFGFDKELIDAFSVKKLVADREPLFVDDEDGLTVVKADIYSGSGTYAVTRDGEIYRKTTNDTWRKSQLSLADVVSRSITRVSGTIKIKVKK